MDTTLPDLRPFISDGQRQPAKTNAMAIDPNQAEPQTPGALIPDGVVAKVTMATLPGGVDGEEEIDRGLLKRSRNSDSDAVVLAAEFAVSEGAYAGRKFRQSFVVSGGKLDAQGLSIGWKISRSIFRGMVDSARGLDPADTSETARTLRGLADLDGIAFIARIKIEPSSDPAYGDRNKLDHAVAPTAPEWRQVMNGEAVPLRPSTQARAWAAGVPGTPALGGPQAPASTSAPTWSQGSASRSIESPNPAAPSGPDWLNG